MKRSLFLRGLSLVAGCALAVQGVTATAADWADLKMTFVYDSATLPNPPEVDITKDKFCVDVNDAKVIPKPQLFVDPESKGIAYIALYPDRKSGIDEKDVHPDLATKDTPAVLDNVKCLFEPHVLSVVAGESVLVKNSDQTGHNANFAFFANDAVNPTIPAGGATTIEIKKAERAPIPVSCGSHPWMQSYVIVTDVPYVGISNEKGELVIEKLPAGKKISMKLWHENSNKSIEQVTIDGKPTSLKRGVLEIELKPGVNDLGVVKIKPDQFKL